VVALAARWEKPTDLLVQQTIKIEFVINLKTAKMLGVLPLMRPREEVIE
jgi:hypothetical protein